MKLLRDEMVRAGETPPLELFAQGVRSEATLEKYTKMLRRVTCVLLEDYLKGDFEERVEQLVRLGRDDPEWTRDLMISMVRKFRERTRLAPTHADYLNPASIGNYFKPIKKLFDMNDVVINWKRVYATYPELDNMPDTTGWGRKEIARMLKNAINNQERAIILVLASSGVRVGALDMLNWGDLAPVYWVDGKLSLEGEDAVVACAMLEIYRGSVEEYTTFITPEAFAVLQECRREWAEGVGREPGRKDPMFVKTRGNPTRATSATIRKRLARVARKAGLRVACKPGKRHDVPLMNGFRRFFNKTTKDTLMRDTAGAHIRSEYMMGHKGVGSLDKNYYKTNALELAADYVMAVPDLTIDDADRLRLSNRRLSDKVRMAEDEKDEKMARMEEKVARMQEEMDRRDREMRSVMLERDELARRGGGNDELVARMQEKMARMQEEVAEVKRREMPAEELLSVLRESAGADDMPKALMDPLMTMMEQMKAAQAAAIKENNERHNAKINELLRAIKSRDGDIGQYLPAGPDDDRQAGRRGDA